MHGDRSSGYTSMSEKQRRSTQFASQHAKAQKSIVQIIKESLLSLLILFVCQLEHESGEISQAIQLTLSPCSKVTIYSNDTLHRGGGGAEGAGSSHLFSPRHSKLFPSNSTALIKISVPETHESILWNLYYLILYQERQPLLLRNKQLKSILTLPS